MANISLESNQFSIKLGLAFGFTLIAYQLISLLLGANYIVSVSHFMFLFLSFFGLPLTFGYVYQKKAQTNGFRELFFGIFRIAAAGILLNMSFEVAMMNTFFTGLQYEIIDTTIVKGVELLQSIGSPEGDVERFANQLEQTKEQVPNRYSLFGLFSNYVTSLGLWILPVAISAFAFKNRTFEKV